MNEKNRKLFEPTKIGSMRLQNRFVMAPMTTNANPNHVIDDGMIDYYEEIAKGGVGMIVCDTQIVSNKIDPWYEAVTIIGTNEQKVRFMALTERLKGYGTKLCVQLTIGPGRNAFPIPGKASVSASAIPGLYDPSQNTRALTLEEVESIPRAFADVALMAKEAGFDAAEVHAHTGYLLDQFISENWNKRTDKYGGSLENRLRLLTEILQAIKEKAGQDFPVFIRVSGQHHFPGGRTLDTFPEIIRKLDEAGYDGFDVDSGSYEAIEWIFPPSYLGDAAYADSARVAKSATSKPVMAAGNQTLESGLKGVEDGSLDYVMLGRGLLADPYFPKKAFEGKDEDIRPCIRCNEFCFARAFAQHPLTCAVNTRVGNEKALAIKKSEQPKKVAIVGGGVSGLEAARVAALKGHSVTVYEKSNQLGGQVIAAAAPPFKKQLKRFLEYLIRQVKQLGVAIVYNKAITANSPELKNADEILVAIGASSIKPGIPGMDNGKVIDVIDAHTTRHGEIGSTVVIAGGGLSGCDCAIELAMESKQVTIVEMLSRVAMKSNLANQPCINKVLAEKKVTVLTDSKVLSFGDEGVTIENKEGKKQVLAADTIITAFGTKANSELADEIFLNNQKVKVIGDCCTVGLVGTAVRDGFMAAWAID